MKTHWQSTSVAEIMMTQQLRWGLRLRMLGSWLYLGLEVAGFVLIAVLGVIQVAMGQVAAGAMFIGLVLVCAGASLWARRASLRGASGSLTELVDLSLRRARRGVRMAWANYFMTAASVVCVLALYMSDIGDPDAAYHDDGRVVVAMRCSRCTRREWVSITCMHAAACADLPRCAHNRLREVTYEAVDTGDCGIRARGRDLSGCRDCSPRTKSNRCRRSRCSARSCRTFPARH